MFATKLSLPKFVSLINRLTPRQRDLVCSIGLESILHICCESLPRRLIIYIVSRFNPKSRVLTLSNGSSYTLSPSSIHKTLGTPIGGKKIGEKVDPNLREFIAQLTKCKGHYPTINELDILIPQSWKVIHSKLCSRCLQWQLFSALQDMMLSALPTCTLLRILLKLANLISRVLYWINLFHASSPSRRGTLVFLAGIWYLSW